MAEFNRDVPLWITKEHQTCELCKWFYYGYSMKNEKCMTETDDEGGCVNWEPEPSQVCTTEIDAQRIEQLEFEVLSLIKQMAVLQEQLDKIMSYSGGGRGNYTYDNNHYYTASDSPNSVYVSTTKPMAPISTANILKKKGIT